MLFMSMVLKISVSNSSMMKLFSCQNRCCSVRFSENRAPDKREYLSIIRDNFLLILHKKHLL